MALLSFWVSYLHTYNKQVRKILLSSGSEVHCLFTVKLVVAAFNLAAVVSDYKNVEHQNLYFFLAFASPL
jgi:hypothetical protein